LSTRLKRYVYLALVALALYAAVMVAWPAPAQAQVTSTDGARAADASPARVVVEPGDSLWSMSQRLLPANATPQQIYNEAARIYALNRDRIGQDPNLIHPGEVLLLAPAREPVADPVVDGRPGRGAEPALSERAPEKAAAAEPSRKTAQRASRDVYRDGAREPSGVPTHQPLPELARAPIPKPVAEPAPKTASDEARRLLGGRLLAAAVVGTAIGWGAMCLILAVGFLVARKLPAMRTTHKQHERWETPAKYWHNGGHQRRPEAAPSVPDLSPSTPGRPAQERPQPLRSPPPKLETRTPTEGKFR
jgi:hypothetical protein